jgi:dihydrofolate reductase
VGKVIVSKSMSLDGYVAGTGVSAELPMGAGGLKLHQWFLEGQTSEFNVELMRADAAAIGAVVLGKRTYSVGVDIWDDTPFPVPTFVLTHQPQAHRVAKSATFTFVTDGIESALRQAKAAAGEKNVVLMGADVSSQYLHAGLVDEVHITLVPVLLGSGTRLFPVTNAEPTDLESLMSIESGGVCHLRYRCQPARRGNR